MFKCYGPVRVCPPFVIWGCTNSSQKWRAPQPRLWDRVDKTYHPLLPCIPFSPYREAVKEIGALDRSQIRDVEDPDVYYDHGTFKEEDRHLKYGAKICPKNRRTPVSSMAAKLQMFLLMHIRWCCPSISCHDIDFRRPFRPISGSVSHLSPHHPSAVADATLVHIQARLFHPDTVRPITPFRHRAAPRLRVTLSMSRMGRLHASYLTRTKSFHCAAR